MRGPFTLPTPSALAAEQRKRAGIARVKAWAESHVPKEKLESYHCIVDTSEIACTDPNCALIDTVVRLLFKGNVGCGFRLPREAAEVTKEILDENMPPEEYIEGWIQGRNDLEWPPRHDPVLVEGEGPPKDVELRFGVNTRVECCIGKGEDGWVAGTITELWYRHPTWGPRDYAPYQIQLDDYDGKIFAPQDSDVCIRLLRQEKGAGTGERSAPAEQNDA